MKSFKNFMIEEVEPAAFVEKGKVDCSNHAVRDNINMLLSSALDCSHYTPYAALQKVSKVLAMFHITLPKTNFLEGPHGFETFRLQQFGNTLGMRNDGSVVTKIEDPYTLYFEWMQDERGRFKIFSEIVSDDDLMDLLNAAEKEVNDEDPAEDRDEKIYEAEEKEIKKAYKVAAKDPNDEKVQKHLKSAAKIVKKKLERGEKINEGLLQKIKSKLQTKETKSPLMQAVDKLKEKQEREKKLYKSKGLDEDSNPSNADRKALTDLVKSSTDSKTKAPSETGGESMAVSVQKKGESQSKPGFLNQLKEARKGTAMLGGKFHRGETGNLKSRKIVDTGDHLEMNLHTHPVIRKHKKTGEVHFNLQADKTGGRASNTTKTTVNDAFDEMGIEGRVSVKGGKHYFRGEEIDGNKWISTAKKE